MSRNAAIELKKNKQTNSSSEMKCKDDQDNVKNTVIIS